MAKIYKVLVNGGSGAESKPISVMQGVGDKGSPVRIVAQKGVRYELQDEAKGKGAAPDQVRVKRVGNNLTLMFDGSQKPDVVVEDFYALGSANDGNLPVLGGLAENGSVYEYIPQDPALSSVTPALVDGNTPVLMALGGGALGDGFVLSALPIAAAAGGLSGWAIAGAAVGAAALGGGGGGGGAAPDTTPPGVVTALAVPEAADGGVNAAEVADDTTVEITLPTDAVAGDTVTTVLTDPNGNPQTLTHVLTAAEIAAKSITQNIPVANLKDANGNFIDGTWKVTTTVTDAAKNVSKAVDSSFVLDTTAPSADNISGHLKHDAANDTGAALDDNITSNSTPVLVVKAEAGATVDVVVNGKTYRATESTTTAGEYEVNVLDKLDDVTYTPSITVTDKAGNKTTKDGVAFTVDASAPSADNISGHLKHDEANDTGAAQDDNITSNSKPVLVVKAETGATVDVVVNGNTYRATESTTTAGEYEVLVGTKEAEKKLADNAYTPSIKVTDAAGNVTTKNGVAFTVDTKAPETDTETPLNPSTGKASLVLDDVPIDGMVTGTVRGDFTAGDEVTLKISDKTYTYTVGADGRFSVQVPHDVLLADADKTIEASLAAHDAAGNLGIVSAAKTYEVDGMPPIFESPDVAAARDENIAAGTVVYQAKAADTGFIAPATATAVSYSLKAGANDSDAFSIDAATGDVKLTASPNYEVKPNYTFVVIAKDAAGNTAEQTITLAIKNVDEVAPTITSPDKAAQVDENISTDTVVYTVKAEDAEFNLPDTKDSVTYWLKSGDDANALSINNSTGAVKFKASPNFEDKSSYVFTVQAKDTAGNVSEKKVTLEVLNIAEVAELSYKNEPGRFTGTSSADPLQWTVKVVDQDAGQSQLISTSEEVGTYGKFEIVGATTGDVYAWKYTLDAITPTNELGKLVTIGHDLQVVQSFDGSAYKTIDIAINTYANTTTQIFNTNSTVGLTVGGLATKTDTLVLHGLIGPSLTLDLTLASNEVGHTQITSIETIDLTGPNNYTVTLNMDSLTQADNHKLFIDGNAGDKVQITGHATIPNSADNSSAYYRYVFEDASELLVQHGMAVYFSA